MNFSELQTQVSNKVGYNDQATKIPTYINSAIHQLEQEDSWPHMENKTTGNLTSSVDYVAIPTRYKSTKSLIITNSNKQKALLKTDYLQMISEYPDGAIVKGVPRVFARKESEGNFIIRPYPADTYPYELLTNVFSADLSADTDTNYWTSYNWEIVMYGALIQFELDSGQQLKLGTEEAPLSPLLLYQNLLNLLIRSRVREKSVNGISRSRATWVY